METSFEKRLKFVDFSHPSKKAGKIVVLLGKVRHIIIIFTNSLACIMLKS